MVNYHIRPCERGNGAEVTRIEGTEVNLSHLGLVVVELEPGGRYVSSTGETEVILLPLAGGFAVSTSRGEEFVAHGRSNPITEISDYVYLTRDVSYEIVSQSGCRLAIPSAVAKRSLPNRYSPSSEVTATIRGGGASSRQINALIGIGAGDSDSLIVGEILTPGGGWSSYPAHKHDTPSETESVLEEIYYFEISDGAGPEGSGFAYQRVLTSDERDIDLLVEARHGDVLAIPYGWHGPVVAAPGHDLYNLYLMAGPNGREWNITDHPDQHWIRGTWESEPPHPRLPLATQCSIAAR